MPHTSNLTRVTFSPLAVHTQRKLWMCISLCAHEEISLQPYPGGGILEESVAMTLHLPAYRYIKHGNEKA